MSSVLKPSVASPGGITLPFASYAQIIRMLVPPADRISFHDAQGAALWINDGVDEPELRMHVDIVLSRARQAATVAPSRLDDGSSFVFAIRNPDNMVVGAIGIVCRNLTSGARFRTPDAMENMLAPVMTILGHAWPAHSKVVALPVASSREAGTRQAAVAAAQLDPHAPVPAMLRRALSLATGLIDCAFGAVVLPERPFTLSHCVSTDESDLSVTAAIDNVRSPVLRWMKTRNEPLVVNSASSKARQMQHKLLVVPVRNPSQQVVALLMLFRSKHARDFAGVDVDELIQLAARVPTQALTAMAVPEVPVIASIVKPPQKPAPAKQAATVQEPAAVAPKPVARPAVATRTPALPARPATAGDTQSQLIAAVAATPASATMDERIRTALKLGSFDLYAQNIAHIREASESPRFEVLLRMRDAGKLHGPSSFFAVAESSRLMAELDCWVIGELLKTLRKRAVTVRASSLEFSINIAGQSLATAQFGEFIVAEVCRTAIPAGLLVFEISERTVLEHEDDMNDLSARLRDVGCRIALDNCRSGLGTLDPLGKWPISRVKIDGSLIRHLGTSGRAESQVRALAQLAADRGIETVAERVESERVKDKLLEMGIDLAQGFHFAKPQPLQTLFR